MDKPVQYQDVKDLWRLFRLSFDQSRVTTILEADCQGLTHLGGGVHFEAFRLPGMAVGGMDLVVKRMRQEGWRRPELLEWQRGLEALRDRRPLLVPPFAILSERDEAYALVMPEGRPLIAAELRPHWQFVVTDLQRVEVLLQANGVVIDDALQLSHWQGIPFIHDLSDLRWSDPQPTSRMRR